MPSSVANRRRKRVYGKIGRDIMRKFAAAGRAANNHQSNSGKQIKGGRTK